MPGTTLEVGPTEVRVGDMEIVGEQLRRIRNMTVRGPVGKLLVFADGGTRELKLGQTIRVYRPVQGR